MILFFRASGIGPNLVLVFVVIDFARLQRNEEIFLGLYVTLILKELMTFFYLGLPPGAR